MNIEKSEIYMSLTDCKIIVIHINMGGQIFEPNSMCSHLS